MVRHPLVLAGFSRVFRTNGIFGIKKFCCHEDRARESGLFIRMIDASTGARAEDIEEVQEGINILSSEAGVVPS